MQQNRIILGGNSVIGQAIAKNWCQKNYDVIATVRDIRHELNAFVNQQIICDFLSSSSVDTAMQQIIDKGKKWHALALLVGTMEPLGHFETTEFKAWENNITVNFTNTLRSIHHLLPYRDKNSYIFLFSGGGNASAPKGVSAYVASKIALIKMCELLASEITDCCVIIMGPGWVKTPIHRQMLNASQDMQDQINETQRRLDQNDFEPLNNIIEFMDWAESQNPSIISGRNFSIPNDSWKKNDNYLTNYLHEDSDLYKLRRKQ